MVLTILEIVVLEVDEFLELQQLRRFFDQGSEKRLPQVTGV
jgi:hypothetical protein